MNPYFTARPLATQGSRCRGGARSAILPFALGSLCLVGGHSPAWSQIEGLSYSLSPTAEWVRWDSNLGLEDATLYGARLGLRFGQAMTLEAFYLQNDKVASKLDAGLFPGITDAPFRNQDVGLKRFGADLILNLAHGRSVPYFLLGGSIQEFDPALGPSFQEIGLQYGGGFRYAFTTRMQGRVALRNLRLRTDRFQMAPLPEDEFPDQVPLDPARDDFRNHLALSVGLDVQLGGYDDSGESEVDRALRARYQAGIRGAAWPIEPFIGSLRYAGSIGLPDQNVLGIRSGIDIGSYLGLRGSYARGMDNGFDDTDPFQTYGAELQFLLSPGPGVRPYLIGGVGYLDYLSSFRDSEGRKVDDETALLAGGGLRFDVGRHVHADLSARDYVTSSRGELESVRSKDDLSDSWLYAAGLTLQVGGGGSTVIGRGDDVPAPVGAVSPPVGAKPGALATRATPAVASTIAPKSAEAGGMMPGATAEQDSTQVAGQPGMVATTAATAEPKIVEKTIEVGSSDNASGRTILLPIPKEGEIYVRYGSPGGVSIESWLDGSSDGSTATLSGPGFEERLRRLIREEIQGDGATSKGASSGPEDATKPVGDTGGATKAAAGGTGNQAEAGDGAAGAQDALTAANLQHALVELENRLTKRMDERVDLRVAASLPKSAENASGTATTKSAGTDDLRIGGDGQSADSNASTPGLDKDDEADERVVALNADGMPVVIPVTRDESGRSLRGITPFSALSVDEPTQFALGVRADLGPVLGGAPLDLLPEFSLSLADNAVWLLGVHARWLVLGRESDRAWKPYVYAGPALLGFNKAVSGFDRTNFVLDVGYGVEHDLGRFRVFAEHQGIDLFDYNRILVGVSGFRR